MTNKSSIKLTQAQSVEIAEAAGKVFQPRTPVNRRDFFAGRWDQMTAINDAVSETGLHVVIYGERGVGKTSIANVIRPLLHVFDEQRALSEEDARRLVIKINASSDDSFTSLWRRALDEIELPMAIETFGFSPEQIDSSVTLREALGVPDEMSIDQVRRALAKLPGSVFVFDEFDRISRSATWPFTDLIKSLSDYSVDSTIVLVGVADTVDELVEDHNSIVRAVVQVPMPRMTPEELSEIIQKAEAALEIKFADDASSRIVRMSQGLPHYTHLVGQNAARRACQDLSRRVETSHVNDGFIQAVRSANQSVRSVYETAIHSAHPDALYAQVLLACALAAYSSDDSLGYFQASQVAGPLGEILGKNVMISTFNRHLTEFCDKANRGRVLERKGKARSYRYRFCDPLLPPFILMKGIADKVIGEDSIHG